MCSQSAIFHMLACQVDEKAMFCHVLLLLDSNVSERAECPRERFQMEADVSFFGSVYILYYTKKNAIVS